MFSEKWHTHTVECRDSNDCVWWQSVNLLDVPSGEAKRNRHTYRGADVIIIEGQTHGKYDSSKTVFADREGPTPVIRKTASRLDTEPVPAVLRSYPRDSIKTLLYPGPCERFVTRNIWRWSSVNSASKPQAVGPFVVRVMCILVGCKMASVWKCYRNYGICSIDRWSSACVGGAGMPTNMSVYFV